MSRIALGDEARKRDEKEPEPVPAWKALSW
jgi:hypothetical protein